MMWYHCDSCYKAFRAQAACEQHMTSTGHWGPRVPCESCPLLFHTQESANVHMDELGHWKHTCSECGEHFASALYLEMHLKSNVHRPHHHECPFCFDGFATPSAVVHHLESTCCKVATWLDIDYLFSIIKSVDPLGLITISSARPQIKKDPPVIRLNGLQFECHLCSRLFNRQAGLEAHLNSPIHRRPIYHCLNSVESCGKEFVSLAALWNHIESEACGIMWFEDLEHVHNQIKRAALCRHVITHAHLAI